MTDVWTRPADGGRLDDERMGVNPQHHRPGRDARRHRRRLALDSHRCTAADVNLPARGLPPPSRGLKARLGETLGPGLVASTLVLLAGVAAAAELLVGTMSGGNGTAIEFGLEAEDREAVEGGRILLGETAYEISRVSRLGLIGARRFVRDGDAREPYAEFLVLSSSFGEQTAVGKPWVAASESHGCEEPYNTFLAVYRVEGEAAVKALGPTPYPELAENLSRSHDSRVFCFIAGPPG